MRKSSAEHFVLPVGVLLAIFLDVLVDESNRLAVVAEVLCEHIEESIGRKRGVGLASRLHLEVGSEVHLWLTLLTLLGGDDNHTVRCTRTVDSGSRSILEDSHVLDVVRSNHREGVAHTLNA